MPPNKTKSTLPPLRGRQAAWLAAYCDPTSHTTFMNATASAEAAGYQAKNRRNLGVIGHENLQKLKPHVEHWLDQAGFTEERIKLKVLSLMDALETKFFQHEGIVTDTRRVEALGIQLGAVQLAARIKGLFAPQEVKVTGLSDLAGRLTRAHQREEGDDDGGA